MAFCQLVNWPISKFTTHSTGAVEKACPRLRDLDRTGCGFTQPKAHIFDRNCTDHLATLAHCSLHYSLDRPRNTQLTVTDRDRLDTNVPEKSGQLQQHFVNLVLSFVNLPRRMRII